MGEACTCPGAGLGEECPEWVRGMVWTGERGTGECRGTGEVAHDDDRDEDREERGPGEWGGMRAGGVGGKGDTRPATNTAPPGDSLGEGGGKMSEGEF